MQKLMNMGTSTALNTITTNRCIPTVTTNTTKSRSSPISSLNINTVVPTTVITTTTITIMVSTTTQGSFYTDTIGQGTNTMSLVVCVTTNTIMDTIMVPPILPATMSTTTTRYTIRVMVVDMKVLITNATALRVVMDTPENVTYLARMSLGEISRCRYTSDTRVADTRP